MAKKSKKQKRKKQQRRHHFVEQTGQTSETASASKVASENTSNLPGSAPDEIQSTETPSSKPSPDKVIDHQLAERIMYMRRDSRLTALVAGSIMVGLFVLWILFDHTSLGPNVYKLIKFN